MTKLNITLTVPVEINLEDLDGISVEDIETYLDYQLQEEWDHRHAFSVEMLTHGFAKALKESVVATIEAKHIEMYPGLVTYTKDGEITGDAPKWTLTSRHAVNKICVHIKGFFTSKIR